MKPIASNPVRPGVRMGIFTESDLVILQYPVLPSTGSNHIILTLRRLVCDSPETITTPL